MEPAIQIIAVILGVIGLIGCLLPVIPGPPLGWLGLLLLFIWGPEDLPVRLLLIWAVVTVLVTVLDYLAPSIMVKKAGGSKTAGRGSLAGMLVGLLFSPIGMIIGAFAGAMLAEMIFERKSASAALNPALASFIGFVCSTMLKLVVTGWMLIKIIQFL